jgi:putative toxin-antitoxin system antitoxin component (TIGR02293 family)
MASQSETLRIQLVLGGRQALGQHASNEVELIGMVRAGLPHSALESVMDLLGLSADSISASLALPKRTLARRKNQKRLSAEESDRVLRLARIAAAALETFGDTGKASGWLQKPNRALGNLTPLSRLDTDMGARQVERVLGRIDQGVFS